jgi:hypothetical protein
MMRLPVAAAVLLFLAGVTASGLPDDPEEPASSTFRLEPVPVPEILLGRGEGGRTPVKAGAFELAGRKVPVEIQSATRRGKARFGGIRFDTTLDGVIDERDQELVKPGDVARFRLPWGEGTIAYALQVSRHGGVTALTCLHGTCGEEHLYLVDADGDGRFDVPGKDQFYLGPPIDAASGGSPYLRPLARHLTMGDALMTFERKGAEATFRPYDGPVTRVRMEARRDEAAPEARKNFSAWHIIESVESGFTFSLSTPNHERNRPVVDVPSGRYVIRANHLVFPTKGHVQGLRGSQDATMRGWGLELDLEEGEFTIHCGLDFELVFEAVRREDGGVTIKDVRLLSLAGTGEKYRASLNWYAYTLDGAVVLEGETLGSTPLEWG